MKTTTDSQDNPRSSDRATHFIVERSRRAWSEIKKLPRAGFFFGLADYGSAFLAHHPDSYAKAGIHPEFKPLFRKFRKRNKKNNAGDIARLWTLILNIKQVLAEGIAGDFAELGVWRGNTAAVLAFFAAHGNRRAFLFDTFQGFDDRDLKGVDSDKTRSFTKTSIEMVREVIGDDAGACSFVQGYFPDSIQDAHRSKRFAVVSLDCDLYEPMKAGLEFFYPRMPRGGLLLLHDYSSTHWPGARQAIDEFCEKNDEFVILAPDKSGSALIRKSR